MIKRFNKCSMFFLQTIVFIVPTIGHTDIVLNEQKKTISNRYSKDNLGRLIELKSDEYQKNTKRYNDIHDEISQKFEKYNDYYETNTTWESTPKFESWLNRYNNRRKTNSYRNYLASRLGVSNVPPMSQMLLTARNWSKCGAEPYEVPPRYLWNNILPTLQLLSDLKKQGIVPPDTVIRSVYRNARLNRCAKGSPRSKHRMNAAMDLWSPSFNYGFWQKRETQNKLCNFWKYQGQKYNFGLGLYPSGSIHIDTQGYRKWGANHSSASSPCNY